MRAAAHRPFTLRDGIVIVVVAAISTWLSRDELAPWLQKLSTINWRGMSGYQMLARYNAASLTFRLTEPLIAVLTLALVMLRLVHPRPNLRRLYNQPGFSANVAATLAILITGATKYAGSAMDQWSLWPAKVSATTLLPHGLEPGIAVSAAWMLLLVGKRWRAEPSWIDRFGSLVGGLWIATILMRPSG